MRRRSMSTYGSQCSSCPIERCRAPERVRVGRLVLEHGVVGLDRLVEVLELGLVELGDLVEDLLLLGGDRSTSSRFFS